MAEYEGPDAGTGLLEGDKRAHKKSVYEPSGTQRCRQIICSRNKAMAATIVAGVVIVAVALFAAFARPVIAPSCPAPPESATQASTELEIKPDKKDYLTPSGEDYPYKDLRLPTKIKPEFYRLFMHPNITESWFKGNVEIDVRVVEVTDYVVFHAKRLNITCVSVSSVDGGGKLTDLKVPKFLQQEKLEQVYVKFPQQMSKGQKLLIRVEFEAKLERVLAGFYKSTYKVGNETRSLASTHFEPTDARAAFPCFDEPEMKAQFKMTIVREPKHITLFNMPLNNTKERADGLLEDNFKESVKMSTYLVAFIVCDFANLTSTTKTGTMVRVFAPTHLIEQAKFALESAVKVLEYYDTFFGIPYPLPKQDMVAIPDFPAGAMENWGLIMYRMTAILYDPKESSSSSQQWVATVVAHELAHQWFGNLVTMEWWDDLWLNEGFAAFMENIGADLINKDWKMFDQFVMSSMLKAMHLDALSNSHPIQVTVSDPNQISEIFDTISYDKGSSIIRMLESFLGSDTFKAGLQSYLRQHSYGNSKTVDLWKSMSQASGIDVTTIMATWTSQMGYPVVTLKRTGNKIDATQERFFISPPSEKTQVSPFGYKWYIPLTYVTSVDQSKAPVKWMNLSSVSFTIPAESTWIKANYKTTGFYRVNYDPSMWAELTNILKTNHKIFTGGDRAGLIDDVFSLFRSGRVEPSIALDLSTYMVREQDYVPWSAMFSSLSYLSSRLMDTPAFEDFKEYYLNLLKPIMGVLGWEDTGPHLQKYLRRLVLSTAIQLGHPGAVAQGKALFYSWQNEGKSIPGNLKSLVFLAGVKYGGRAEWDYCFQQYKQTSIASDKHTLLVTLGDTKDTMILQRLLQYSLDPTVIRPQDMTTVIGSVAGNPAGRLLAWRFVRMHWDEILKALGSGLFTVSEVISSTASQFSTQFDYNEVKQFFETHNVGSGARAAQQALESIQMNIKWLDKYTAAVTAWLKQNKNIAENA